MATSGANSVSRDNNKRFLDDIETRLFINNEFVTSEDGKKFEVTNPATEELTISVYEAGAADVEQAVQAAKGAFPSWSALSGFQRAEYFYKLADLFERSNLYFAKLEAVSMGKPVGKYSMSSGKTFDYLASLTFSSRGNTLRKIHQIHGRESCRRQRRVVTTDSQFCQLDAPAALRRLRRHYAMECARHGADLQVGSGSPRG